jgi:GNAT superfamily N-acetyltransferase
VKLRLGTPADLDDVLAIRREVAAWLASTGSDQWSTDWPDTETMVSGFRDALAAGETWIAADDDGTPLAVVTVNDRTDAGLWTPGEVVTALFVHRLTVRRAAAGRGLGARLLDHADDLARRAGREWLRLDCWTDNARLHRYYRNQGFRHVRTVPDLDSPSGACYERKVAAAPGPAVTDVSGHRHTHTVELSSTE